MTNTPRPKSAYLRQRAGVAAGSRHAASDVYQEEFDEIESLPFDAEHDEDDRDPEPDRRLYSEHAQVRHAERKPAREGKSRM